MAQKFNILISTLLFITLGTFIAMPQIRQGKFCEDNNVT